MLTPMTKPNPIAVRPRQGSELEAVWNENQRSNRAMGEIIHSWAVSFSEMTKASDKREEEMASRIGTNTGHGHAWKRPDGVKMRCGGVRMCAVCNADHALVCQTIEAGKAALEEGQ